MIRFAAFVFVFGVSCTPKHVPKPRVIVVPEAVVHRLWTSAGTSPGAWDALPIVRVEQFGARAGDLIDDAPAIQAALDSVHAPTIVQIPPGTFILRKPIRIPSSVMLQG